MDFEMYEKMTGMASDPNPRVVLTDSVLSFNPAAVKEYLDPLAQKEGLNYVGYVELGYNPKIQTIGLFAAAEENRKTLCVQQKKGESARIGVTGFIKRFKLKDKTYHLLNVQPQEKGLYLTFTDETIQKKEFKKKETLPPPAPAPQLGEPSKPQPPSTPKSVDYMCQDCGHSDLRWKYQYRRIGGHPKGCVKCNGTVFVPIQENPVKKHLEQ